VKPLRLGSKGIAVQRWQAFLRGQGAPVVETGIFDDLTDEGTRSFQRKSKLLGDGIVGNDTIGRAASLGFEVVSFIDSLPSGYPPEPTFAPLASNAQRQKLFGPMQFVSAPSDENPERIKITNSWDSDNIVKVKLGGLIGKKGASASGNIEFNKRAIKSLTGLFTSWETAGLLDRILTWDGSYVPRYVRGSRTILSNHAFGTAFDINAQWNARGTEPAWPDEEGCVFDLVQAAHSHGFYWGGHFETRDGMHFEWAGD
jgi:D-alanyl-D-alanine carboxypeptidase